MSEYEASTTSLIADVDCTAGGKSLCEKHDIRGYPSIKYGDPAKLEDYNGGRDLASLKKFAAENLGPTCGPDNLDLCDEAEKGSIKKFQKWDIDELEMKIEEGDEKIKKINDASAKLVQKYNDQISDLRSKIEKEEKKRDDKTAKESNKLGLKHMRAVKIARDTAEAGDKEEL